MKSKTVGLAIVVAILLLVGWLAAHYCYLPAVPPAAPPVSGPAPELPGPSPDEQYGNGPEPPVEKPPARGEVSPGESPDFSPLTVEKRTVTLGPAADLADQSMSIKSRENKGYEVCPGVNVKSGVVHVQLDQDDTKAVEVEKNPANSNNKYQLLLKRKF